MGKRACLKLLCLMLLLLSVLSGCGKGEEDQLGIDGYVYRTYQIDIKGSSADKFKVLDGYIYYRLRNNEAKIDDLRRFPVDDILSINEEVSVEGDSSMEKGASVQQPRLPSAESLFSASGGSRGYISDYAVDEDGCFYYLMEKLNARDVPVLRPVEGTDVYVMDYGDISYVLVKQLADGTEAYSVSLPGTPRSLALGGEGWIYVLMKDCIFVLDDEGRALDQLPVAAFLPGRIGWKRTR